MSSTLSNRGAEAGGAAAQESEIWEIISNLWDPKANPTGYISLGVAENSLMHDELRDFINALKLVDADSKALTYGDGPGGSKKLRAALAPFITKHFRAVRDVLPEQIMATNGVTSAIEHTAWALADPGEGILLGRPYYRAFLPDISFRTGCKVVPVSFAGCADPLGPECVARYEEALVASNAAGVKIRALVLCHPHNPLGRCYSRDVLIELMKMCERHKIHLVSDEIYALSTFENRVDGAAAQADSTSDFVSVLEIGTAGIMDPSLLHVLWGMSKDFGANGLRLGVIISQSNPAFIMACRTCSLYSYPSALTENAVTAMLTDTQFVERYIRENQKRLADAHALAVEALRKYEIPYTPGVNAGFFLWVNLGKKYLEKHPEEKVQGEGDPHAITGIIFKKLMQTRVFVVDGEAAGAEEPGWFRLVFTQPRDMVEEGIKRIAEAVA